MTLNTYSGKLSLLRQEVSLDRNLLENGAYSMLRVSFVKTYFLVSLSGASPKPLLLGQTSAPASRQELTFGGNLLSGSSANSAAGRCCKRTEQW
jgi:hypothetical protein